MNEIDLRKIDLNLLVVFEALMAERSVTRAAARLGRTQSAVSHALGRLRVQLDDPLLVKVGRGMEPSPAALKLIEQVHRILRDIERALRPNAAFDPKTSTRTFRLALPDVAATLFPRLVQRLSVEAPGIVLEWISPSDRLFREVAEGEIDLAFTRAYPNLPEGVATEDVGVIGWSCFLRRGHPALADWNVESWSAWPHVVVRIGNRPSPVDLAAAATGVTRRVGAWVPQFSAIAPLVAASDFIATAPTIVMVDAIPQFDLVSAPVPMPVETMPHLMYWSTRLAQEAGLVWLRDHLRHVLKESLREAALAFGQIQKPTLSAHERRRTVRRCRQINPAAAG
jgi:LysR family transcriptional activator of mexEF-oprN operon